MRLLLRAIEQRRGREEAFGLIEEIVVILVLVILIAIAIPLFLGARVRANDRSARASLRVSLTGAKTIYTDTGSYVGATSAALAKAEPALKFLTTASTGPKVVRVLTSTAKDVMLSAQSASSKCYFITDSAKFGSGFAVESGTCAAAVAPAVLAAKPAVGSIAAASATGKAPTWASEW